MSMAVISRTAITQHLAAHLGEGGPYPSRSGLRTGRPTAVRESGRSPPSAAAITGPARAWTIAVV